ncbi:MULTISPECIES: DNA repair protein RecO [unclassified Colwellia]|uniref:DNA repair protein RecO n=1 Tax=unclassified Colwellia TaxID=196834 RepID=UPI0015F3DD61|nr:MULTISPECIES: DNA repair protein RecO [unclassified Colwellia]MBA6233303.1 DNA repair protein RecO [Colwellia sp. MB02u-7]MBA6236393.1 DNA repair protein RecO [Colwellia sp. MB02u-11]MBA6256927.1 DNA repair protein RecO [Colwellia sp. MB3u-28]MBA6261067.1 DNA repair protein RecO [Colwellia sp. MB3u-41]MBA6298207.1 DNA repair protein RecO [Colwellia sp. MB3u-22]
MEEFEQSAFLLHSRPYRENQILLEFLTSHQGKISAISYLGHSLKSNKKALLQPFSPLKIVLKGKGNLKYLQRVEPARKSYQLSGNYLYSGFYLNELQVRLLGEHIPYDELYCQYQESIKQLSKQRPIEFILRHFENRLLEELGMTIDYSPLFSENNSHYYYLPEKGFVPAITKLVQTGYNSMHLKAIAQEDLSSKEVMQTYKGLMRQIINHLLDGKPLNSRKLFTKNS